jgi:dihydroneopterin aldolase
MYHAGRADAVFVRGLEFEGNHGYTAAERRGTRRFRVDVTIERDLLGRAATSDKLADTIDYWKLSASSSSELGTKSTFKLIEALAGAMADAILAAYPGATVTITLDKLAPALPRRAGG